MIVNLRDQLGSAKNANQMFKIFLKYNSLLERNNVRSSIKEYQIEFIKCVREEIDKLKEKYKQNYAQSKWARMSRVKDIPPMAAHIIWVKQLERQLNLYLIRIETVLGNEWHETYLEGKKLKFECENFRLKLNIQNLYENWSNKLIETKIPISSKILQINNTQFEKKKDLNVNFSLDVITLTKEVRNMKYLLPHIQLVIMNKAHTVKQMYPYAVSLLEDINCYKKICDQINERPHCLILIASLKKHIQNLIIELSNLLWSSYKLEIIVPKFNDAIFNFRERIDLMFSINAQIESKLNELFICSYKRTEFENILNNIQKSIDYLNLKGFANLPQWVDRLDKLIEKKLVIRLHIAILTWEKTLLNLKQSSVSKKRIELNDLFKVEDIYNTNDLLLLNRDEPLIKKLTLEIFIKNQILFIYPTIEDVRSHLFTQLYEYLSIITSQQRILHSRYQVTIETRSKINSTFINLIYKSNVTLKFLEKIFTSINNIINEISKYIDMWFQYQAVWDLQIDILYSRLGTDLKLWINCLKGMKESRKSLDSLETKSLFGPISIDYTKVQFKISVKYDACHKDVLSKFGVILSSQLKEFYQQCASSRQQLEMKSIEVTSSSTDAIILITDVQVLKKKLNDWKNKVNLYKEAQNILISQRYTFPTGWIFVDQLNGEWSAFNEILTRKDQLIQSQILMIQSKLNDEENTVNLKTNQLVNEWELNKPVSQVFESELALNILEKYETKLYLIKKEHDKIINAKDSLDFGDSKQNSRNKFKIEIIIQELIDLKEMWSELDKICKQLNILREQQWMTIQLRHLRTSLENLLKQIKDFPLKFRQYKCYNFVKTLIENYINTNVLLVELKSEALKDRHWKILMKKLNTIWNLNDLTIGSIWDANLNMYSSILKEMCKMAQGEKVIEEFLNQISEFWKQYQLELTNYQNKCQIINGWNDIFNKIKEHLGNYKINLNYKNIK